MDKKLDDKCEEFVNILFETKGILDIHKVIRLNSKQIVRPYGDFFWLINKLSIKSYAINISMLFEKQNKTYPLNSIFGILNYLENQNIPACDSSTIESYIQDKTGNPVSLGNHIDQLRVIVDDFCNEKSTSLERFKHARDKKFAHSESIEDQIKDLPSYDEMEKVFDFCFEFICVISSAYLNVVQHKINNDNRFSRSICKLLVDTGIEKVVTEFPD